MAVFHQYLNPDLSASYFADPNDGLLSLKSTTGFSLVGEGWRYAFSGTGFTYNADGEPVTGTVTSFALYDGTTLASNFTGFSVSATTLADDPEAAYELMTAGADFFYGHDGGADYIYTGAGADKMYGYGGEDDIDGGAGNDSLYGGNDADFVFGGTGDDKIYGQAGDDWWLDGEAGNDLIDGGVGNDFIVGGLGADVLTGSLGADTFYFEAFRESLRGAKHDVIKDFNHSQGDLIDLSEIDANGTVAGHGEFDFLATKGAAFTGVAGELRWYWSDVADPALDKTFIEGDINGDMVADLQIELTGLKSLVASDFVLVWELPV